MVEVKKIYNTIYQTIFARIKLRYYTIQLALDFLQTIVTNI